MSASQPLRTDVSLGGFGTQPPKLRLTPTLISRQSAAMRVWVGFRYLIGWWRCGVGCDVTPMGWASDTKGWAFDQDPHPYRDCSTTVLSLQ